MKELKNGQMMYLGGFQVVLIYLLVMEPYHVECECSFLQRNVYLQQKGLKRNACLKSQG